MVAQEKGKKGKKGVIIFLLVVVLALAGFVYVRYFYVLGEGWKAGQLNYVVYKGYVFKTYEGKLIQSGLRSGTTGAVQSNEFIFSVDKKNIAEELMQAGGKEVNLHYKEYMGAIPWRGYSKYMVDEYRSN